MDELSKLRRTVEEVIRENKRLAAEITELRVQRFVHFHEEECWVYQGDGSDYLESLVCPVIISPKRLLELENRDRIAMAYGYLWHVNNEPGTPNQYPPERAAYEARKILRDTMTHEQRGEAINRVRAIIVANEWDPAK